MSCKLESSMFTEEMFHSLGLRSYLEDAMARQQLGSGQQREEFFQNLFKDILANTPAREQLDEEQKCNGNPESFLHDLVKNVMKSVHTESSSSRTESSTNAKCTSGVVHKDDAFEVTLDVAGYDPEELAVKVCDGFVSVRGKHESKNEDGSHSESRQFTRKYKLPQDVNIDAVSSSMTADGKVLRVVAPLMTIEAPKETAITVQVAKNDVDAPSDEPQPTSSAEKQ